MKKLNRSPVYIWHNRNYKMSIDSDNAANLYWKRFGRIPRDGAHLRDDPILFLARNIKARLEHDRRWIGYNNHIELAPPIWSIISDYWSEDPRIVDVIMWQHGVAMSRPPYEQIKSLSQPGFILSHHVNLNIEPIQMKMYIQTIDDPIWVDDADDVMTTLLIMPTVNMDWSESENICANPHIPWIRNYLYWRLEHPDEGPKSDDESDY